MNNKQPTPSDTTLKTCQVFVHRDPATAKGRKGGKDDKGEEQKEDREEVT